MIQEDIHHAGMFAEVATFENAPFEIASSAELMNFAGVAWLGDRIFPAIRAIQGAFQSRQSVK